jgi:predicted RNA methylase
MPLETKLVPRLGNTRVTGKEQFYTPPELARSLVQKVESVLGSLEGKSVLEPAGGTGSFVEAAYAKGVKKVIHRKVLLGNFLDQELTEQNLITISNPPFGRNNSLSIPFFNHAASVSDAICFIVPRSWRKWSVTNRLDLNFELVSDQDIDIDYIDSDGELISDKSRLATCFQIWKRSEKTRVPVKVTDMGVIQKVSPELADVSMTIFGYGCGSIKEEFERVPNTTQLFLKLNHPQVLSALRSVNFSKFFKNTAYTEALSIQEINYLLNEQIYGDPMIEGSSK